MTFILIFLRCIIQGDEDDWNQQAAVMANVYERAFITIYAATAKDSQESFLKPRGSWRCESKTLVWSDGVGSIPLVNARRAPRRGPHNKDFRDMPDPLDHRAWAFQEYRLSRRMVVFASDEVQWMCRRLESCECSPNRTSDVNFIRQVTYNYYGWRNLIDDYCHRTLTNSSDRLPALSGLAAKFQRELDSKYLAGMWEKDLVQYLGWSTMFPSAAPSEYRAPSFSWASVDNPVLYHPIGSEDSSIQLLEAFCVPKGSNPYGEVASGFVRLSGRLVPATLSVTPPEYWRINCTIPFTGSGPTHEPVKEVYARMDTLVAPAEVVDDAGVMHQTACRSSIESSAGDWNATVWCLQLGYSFADNTCLILGRSKRVKGAYERLGIVLHQDGGSGATKAASESVFDQQSNREITIV